MKKLLKIVLIIFAIFVAFIIIAAINSANDDKALEALKTAPISSLSPAGELAAIFALGSDYTDIQRENKLKEIKGKVVAWQMPVYEVKREGRGYSVLTQSPDLFNAGRAFLPAMITVTPLSDDDKAKIESLKTGDIIQFKGTIKDVRLRHVIIDPAYLYDGSEKANAAPTANVSEAAPVATDQIAAEIEQVMSAYEKFENTFDCAKAATPIEQQICNEPLLNALDEALAYNMSGMLDSDIGDEAKAEIVTSQKQWLVKRNQCPDAQCLVGLYRVRVDKVCEYSTISGMHHMCRIAEEIQ